MKSKGVTTQTKAFNEYFLMVVFTLLLNRAHVCLFVFQIGQEHNSEIVKYSSNSNSIVLFSKMF